MRSTFIFGAGASAEEGAATGSQVLEKAFNILRGRKPTNEVKDFVRSFFGLEYLPTFEEVLTLVDIGISKREAFSHRWDFDNLIKLRNHLIYCLVMTLDQQLQSSGPLHSLFVKKLFEKYDKRDLSFISLNYDILLDNALTKLYDLTHFQLDYAIDFRNFGIDWDRPDTNAVNLLKLHGSLNWLYCPNCNSLEITPLDKGVRKIWTEFKTCDEDQTGQQPLLIPPTWIKAYDNARLMQVWVRAEEILRKAEKVIFVGYSLPESDAHVRYLLAKSLHRKSSRKPQVIAITQDRTGNAPSASHRRYLRLFKHPQVHEIGFRRFMNNLDKYIGR